MGFGNIVAIFIFFDDFPDILICDLAEVSEHVEPNLLTILYPVRVVLVRNGDIGICDLFLTPDLLVCHDTLNDLLDAEGLPPSADHILDAEPGTTYANITFLFSPELRLKLPQQEIFIVEEFIRAGPRRSLALLAPPHWSLRFLIKNLDFLHHLKIYVVDGIDFCFAEGFIFVFSEPLLVRPL